MWGTIKSWVFPEWPFLDPPGGTPKWPIFDPFLDHFLTTFCSLFGPFLDHFWTPILQWGLPKMGDFGSPFWTHFWTTFWTTFEPLLAKKWVIFWPPTCQIWPFDAKMSSFLGPAGSGTPRDPLFGPLFGPLFWPLFMFYPNMHAIVEQIIRTQIKWSKRRSKMTQK